MNIFNRSSRICLDGTRGKSVSGKVDDFWFRVEHDPPRIKKAILDHEFHGFRVDELGELGWYQNVNP